MATATMLTETLRTRDPDGASHGARVTAIALKIALALGAGPARMAAIRAGGPLHDIGKLSISDSILSKPGPLDADELDEIRRHPLVGARMYGRGDGLECVLHHHERWDGAGYPHGLRGDEIPFEARVLAVADAFDAMISDRPYCSPRTLEGARAEVERCAGTQFDPQVATAFLQL
jgi:HD-GYP domain-containing protein (c-di-GMP phosphodiesterase class II)